MTKDTKPAHLSDAQWADLKESSRARAIARQRGIGLVQVSPRRFDVILDTGVSATKPAGGAWFGYLTYHVVDGGHNLTWDQARRLIHVLNDRLDADHRNFPEIKVWPR